MIGRGKIDRGVIVHDVLPSEHLHIERGQARASEGKPARSGATLGLLEGPNLLQMSQICALHKKLTPCGPSRSFQKILPVVISSAARNPVRREFLPSWKIPRYASG